MAKSPEAFRTISEVAHWLETPTHVLRFWESRFPEIAPVKRAGGRRYYRPEDMQLLGGIKHLLHTEGHTIKAVQSKLEAEGAQAVSAFSPAMNFASEMDAPVTTAPGPDGETDGQQPRPGVPADVAPEPDVAPEADQIAAAPLPEDNHPDADAPPAEAEIFDDPATPEPFEADVPPIGFFFDDSSGGLDGEEPDEVAAPDEAPVEHAPSDQTCPDETDTPAHQIADADWTTHVFSDDPDDDFRFPGVSIPLAAVLRTMTPALFPQPTVRATLSGLHARLSALHNPSE